MDLSLLENLGIALPPETAFRVDLSPRERDTLSFWLLHRLAQARTARKVATVSKAVSAVASVILSKTEEPRMIVVYNNSTTLNVWIAINAVPTTSLGIMIPPNGYWESPFDCVEEVKAISNGDAPITLLTSVR